MSTGTTPNSPMPLTTAMGMLCPPTDSGRGRHPFLLFSGEDVATLRARAGTTHGEIWEPLRHQVDGNLETPPVAEEKLTEWAGLPLVAYAFAAVISADPRHVESAKNRLLAYAGYSTWSGRGRHLGRMLLGNALAYDMLWDVMSRDERVRVRDALSRHAQTQYEEVLTEFYGVSYNTNHCWAHYAGLVMAALALRGEDPHAEAIWLPKARDGIEHIMGSTRGWTGGANPEGVSYYQDAGLLDLMPSLMALKQTATTDLIADGPYLRAYPVWRAHISTPAEMDKYIMHYADGRIGNAWSDGRVAFYLRFCASYYRDGLAEWMARQLRGVIGNRISHLWNASVYEFLVYDPDVSPVPPESDQLHYRAPNLDAIVLRTGWAPEDMVFAVKASAIGGKWDYFRRRDLQYPYEAQVGSRKFEYDHIHWDSLGFYLYRNGAWLAPEEVGYRVYRPPSAPSPRDTRYHNTLLIDGRGQYGESIADREWYCDIDQFFESDAAITHHGHTPGCDHVTVDGTRCYAWRDEPVTLDEVTRQIVFVRPDYFVVADNIRGRKDKHVKWICHFGESVSVGADWIKGVSSRNQVLGVKVVSPEDWTHSCGRHDTGSDSERSDLYPFVCVTTPTPLRDTRYAMVLYPTETDRWDERPLVRRLCETERVTGVEVRFGDGRRDVIAFGFGAESVPVTVGPCSFNGRAAVLRYGASGDLESVFLSAGERLCLEGQELLASSTSITVEASYRDRTLDVQPPSDPGGTVRIRAEGIDQVRIGRTTRPVCGPEIDIATDPGRDAGGGKLTTEDGS